MENLKLKSASQLLLLVQNDNDLFDYIDTLHSKLLDYQSIIDVISHNIKENVGKVELYKDYNNG